MQDSTSSINRLSRRSRSVSDKNRLFISWGGEDAREIAEWIRLNVLKSIPGFQDPFISPLTPPGADWRKTIHDELSNATHCIGIMTDVALTRPWFLYEMAFLRGRLGQIPLLCFAEPALDHPLSAVQHLAGFEFKSVLALASSLLSNHDEVTRELAIKAIAAKAADWSAAMSPFEARHSGSTGLRRAITVVNRTLASEHLCKGLAIHSCMRELACKNLDDVGVTFNHVLHSSHSTFTIPYRRYPEYLTHLQRSLECRTLAVALVDEVEEFWAQKTGSQILDSTSHDSQRVFVFENQSLFDRYFKNVLNHAMKYPVFVMSSAEFSRAAGYRAKGDFSVLTDHRTGHQVTAYYDNAGHNIHFSSDAATISSNLSIFGDLLTRAHRVKPARDENANNELREALKTGMFTVCPDEGLHHSDVIPIYRYDAFEEDHPYYKEMHRRMLTEFRQRVPHPQHPFRVLEVGAGTGHFTKKLIQQPYSRMTIKAMEPDPGAQAVLDQKLQHKGGMVQSIAASALNYEPRGEFQFVFSSFSEHHIRPEDKQRYFRTIIGALEEGGYLIIGDEFLPPHDHDSGEAYLAALEKYHSFIIDEAKKAECFEVAELEALAWESGKPDARVRIDYKMSLSRYKDFALTAGLELQAEFCITPPDLAQSVGGMYVLVCRKPPANSRLT